MKAGHKAWSLYVFSSANAISQYTMRELVELGVSWIWMGLESPRSSYIKLKGADTHRAHRRTAPARHQAAGLDDRRAGTPHAGEHRSGDRARRRARYGFPPVHAVHAGARHAALLRDEGAGAHAARRQPGRHPRAARVQFRARGDLARRIPSTGWISPSGAISSATVPSIYRICRTTLDGWRRYKNDADARVRARFACEARALRERLRRGAVGDGEAPAQDAIAAVAEQVRDVRREIGREFGLLSRVVTATAGPVAAVDRAARRAPARRRARPTSRPPSSSAATGRARSRCESAVPAARPTGRTQGD